MRRNEEIVVSAHHADRTDSYGVNIHISYRGGSQYTATSLSLPLDAFLDMMDVLEPVRVSVDEMLNPPTPAETLDAEWAGETDAMIDARLFADQCSAK